MIAQAPRPPRPPVLGLAGPPGGGKSAAAEAFAAAGWRVVDLDRIGHRCLRRADVKRALARAFGRGVFARRGAGAVDRAALAREAFASPAACRALNRAVHPALALEAGRELARARRGRRAAVVVGTLLDELGLTRRCDFVLCVTAPRASRLRRLARLRGWTAAELARRERCLSAGRATRRRADLVVGNVGTASALRRRIEELLEDQPWRKHPKRVGR